MKELNYPFDAKYILKKRRFLKKNLLDSDENWLDKRIAILGGSTTHDVRDMLELFLLNQGIRPVFYESEYNQFYQEVMFGQGGLREFQPDLIYIHTSSRNILSYPEITDAHATVEEKLQNEASRITAVWERALSDYHCSVIGNNFEAPYYRLMGNMEFSDIHGRVNFINRLNGRLAEFAAAHQNFYINDIHYLASEFGVKRWADPFYWHAYKYACAVEAIPALAYNAASIIKAIYGKNKKAFVLDLDNTLWGGTVGDDGAENIQIGQENAEGQAYAEFQQYIKAHKDIGVLLTVNSKNKEDNALAGLSRPDSVLKPEDFVAVKANWEPKDRNTLEIAGELNIGTDALVFVDDNPAERDIVFNGVEGAAVPEIGDVSDYIHVLDGGRYFETVSISEDDRERTRMYQENAGRRKQQSIFADYGEYLKSLEMRAEIAPFSAVYMARIAQLTNKSNQFNLTTKRCTQAELGRLASDENYITFYGKLIDKFGDNGVVSAAYGRLGDEVLSCEEDGCNSFASKVISCIDELKKDGKCIFQIDLWLMSCRVLKRGMEDAMMDYLVEQCIRRKVDVVLGYYYPTAKNGMVKEFYSFFGYDKTVEDDAGRALWVLDVLTYQKKNPYISVNRDS